MRLLTPGGTCSVPGKSALVAYLWGATGTALVAIAQLSQRSSKKEDSQVRYLVVSMLALLVGGGVMALGILFTCASTFIGSNVSCGVGPLSALIAYSFAIVGSALLVSGVWKVEHWLKATFASVKRKSSQLVGFIPDQ